MAFSRSLLILQRSSTCFKIHHGINFKFFVPDKHILLDSYSKFGRCFSELHIQKEDITEKKASIENGPGLDYFILNSKSHLTSRDSKKVSHPYLKFSDLDGMNRKVHFEVHGCPMNVSDTDVAWSILKKHDYVLARSHLEADIIFLMTCSIRDGAEKKILSKLKNLRGRRNKNKRNGSLVIGVLGCMAERLKSELIESEEVNIVAGPDSYRDLPRLLAINSDKQSAINVLLSHDETYADINPISISENKITAYVSIMRGCDNMCSYCIVPFTRGKERSRNVDSILKEIKHLSENGIKEVTLLGQNVNSYRDLSQADFATTQPSLAKDFNTIYKSKNGGLRFADLLDKVSNVDPEMRIRFTAPHPKDFPDEVLQLINERPNICKNIHLPAQCGSTRILELMRRGYTREAYLDLVSHVRSLIPSVSLTTDMMCGFCSETEEEFAATISLMEEVQYNFCYVYPFSMREKTSAHRKLKDDVPESVKKERFERMVSTFRRISLQLNQAQIGKEHLILVEGFSRRSDLMLDGRNDGCCKVIFPKIEVPVRNSATSRVPQFGDYVEVQITNASSQIMHGRPLAITTIRDFNDQNQYKDKSLINAR